VEARIFTPIQTDYEAYPDSCSRASTRTYCLHSVQTASGEPNKLLSNALQDLILGEKISQLEANPTPQPSAEVTNALQHDT
jgi:hypothetical protein